MFISDISSLIHFLHRFSKSSTHHDFKIRSTSLTLSYFWSWIFISQTILMLQEIWFLSFLLLSAVSLLTIHTPISFNLPCFQILECPTFESHILKLTSSKMFLSENLLHLTSKCLSLILLIYLLVFSHKRKIQTFKSMYLTYFT